MAIAKFSNQIREAAKKLFFNVLATNREGVRAGPLKKGTFSCGFPNLVYCCRSELFMINYTSWFSS